MARRHNRFIHAVAALSLTLLPLPARADDSYVRATVELDGRLRIVTAGGRTIEPEKEPGQEAFAKPRIAPGGATVGWLAAYPNCCTSYPIPLKLVIQTDGKVRSYSGNGVPIWSWGFQMSGTQVAFGQETVHGGFSVHYELREVATGRLLAEWEPEYGPDNRELEDQDPPAWVAELIADR
jgi:hypothetical protein